MRALLVASLGRLSLVLGSLALACAPASKSARQPPAGMSIAAPGEPSIDPTVPGATRATTPFEALPVPGRLDAVVSIPAPRSAPRPLLVATHGAGGSPEDDCHFWRGIVADRAFVLCPRGITLGSPDSPSGYFYDGHFELKREVDAALDAMVARYGARVDAKAAVYVGFSQGATMGALMLPLLPHRFSRAVLIEGGSAEWNLRVARLFRKGGGERVLFLCGNPYCAKDAKLSSTYLQREGVESRAIHAEGAGHTYGGRVEDELRGSLEWLLGADPRWR